MNPKRNLYKIHVELKHFFLFFQVTAILRVCRHRSKTCVCQLSQIHPYFSFFVPPQGTRMYFYKRTQKPVPLGTSNTLFHTAPEAEPRYKLKSIMKEQSYSYALTISRDFYPLFMWQYTQNEKKDFIFLLKHLKLSSFDLINSYLSFLSQKQFKFISVYYFCKRSY